jgi:hypothetical protein
MSWAWIISIGAKVFGYLLKEMTPTLEEALQTSLRELYTKALATENPFDDHAMAMVLEILGIEKP